MVTLKNSQLLQIGTSLVSRRPSRPCKIFKTAGKSRGYLRFRQIFDENNRNDPNFFSKIFASPKFSRRRKIFVTSSPGKFYFRRGGPTPLFSTPLIFPGDCNHCEFPKCRLHLQERRSTPMPPQGEAFGLLPWKVAMLLLPKA